MKRVLVVAMSMLLVSALAMAAEKSTEQKVVILVANDAQSIEMFKDVKGVELTEEQMKSIEGEGWKNAIAYAACNVGLTYIGSLILASAPGINISIIASMGVGIYSGWQTGYPISDSKAPHYRGLGFFWLDWLGPNLD